MNGPSVTGLFERGYSPTIHYNLSLVRIGSHSLSNRAVFIQRIMEERFFAEISELQRVPGRCHLLHDCAIIVDACDQPAPRRVVVGRPSLWLVKMEISSASSQQYIR